MKRLVEVLKKAGISDMERLTFLKGDQGMVRAVLGNLYDKGKINEFEHAYLNTALAVV